MNDPLNVNIPLEGVDTTLPLLPEQDYQLNVAESAIVPNKKGTGHNWALKFVTTQPATSVDGREINVGFPLFMQVALQPAEEAKDPEGFKRQLGQTVDALFGSSKENRPPLTHALIQSAVGKSVIATVKNEEYPQGSGNMSSKIGRLKKAA